jgi:hypothetical protein
MSTVQTLIIITSLYRTNVVFIQGPQAAEPAPATPTGSGGDAKVGASVHESSTEGFSTDKNRNYGVLAGTIALAGAVGWYLLSKPKKSKEEVSD